MGSSKHVVKSPELWLAGRNTSIALTNTARASASSPTCFQEFLTSFDRFRRPDEELMYSISKQT